MTTDSFSLVFTLVPIEFFNTLYMVAISSFLAVVIGGLIGLLLVMTSPGHLIENKGVQWSVGNLMNIGRSIPFVILMVALIPLTRILVGTSLGTTASIVPLAFAAIPFFARIVETSLLEVDKGVIEAAETIGSTPWEIVTKVLIWEALPSLVLGVANLMINVIGYSAMAGTVGGGGLGKIAIQYGYQRFDWFLMTVTIVLIVLLVQCVQFFGNKIAKNINGKRGRSLK